MSEEVYQKVLNDALQRVTNNIVTDCVIGPNCVAVQSVRGIGMSLLPGGTWQKYAAKGLIRSIEKNLKGSQLSVLASRYLEDEPLFCALGLAAINSLLASNGEDDVTDWRTVLGAHKKMAMVGRFGPLLERVRATGIELIIFELKNLPGTRRPEEAPRLMPGCDLVFITGSAFVNKSIHNYFPHISPQADAYIHGPSTPLSPALSGRFTLGGSRATDKVSLFQDVRAGRRYRGMRTALRKVRLASLYKKTGADA